MLEEATQAAFRPPKPLAPEGPECLHGLLRHGDVRGERDMPAIRHEPGRQVQILCERPRVPAADRLQRSAPDEHAVAAQLGRPVGRPSAALARQVHQLLLALRARSATIPMHSVARVPPGWRPPRGHDPTRASSARGIPARPACRHRSHRPHRPAVSSAPTPAPHPSSGGRVRARAAERSRAGPRPQLRWRGQRCDRSIRRRRRPARSAASHPRRHSVARRATTRPHRLRTPRSRPAARSRRRAGRPRGPWDPGALRVRIADHPGAMPGEPADIADGDDDQQLQEARREWLGDGQPGDEDGDGEE